MNHRDLLGLFRSSHRRCSVKKGFLKGLKACNFIKKRLQHWCFPVKFARFLRTSILKNIFERLPLVASPQNTIANSSGAFALHETLTECKVSIFFKHNNFIRSNAATSFIYKLNNISLTFQLTFSLNFFHFAPF